MTHSSPPVLCFSLVALLACGGVGPSSAELDTVGGFVLDPYLSTDVSSLPEVEATVLTQVALLKPDEQAIVAYMSDGNVDEVDADLVAKAVVVSKRPDDSCWAKAFHVKQARSGGVSTGPVDVAPTEGEALACACPQTPSEAVAARSDRVGIMDEVHASLGAPWDKPGQRDPDLEAELVAAFNDIGWTERFYGAVILSADFQVHRSYEQMTHRTFQVEMFSRKPDGSCQHQNFGARQQRTPDGWGRPSKNGVGGQGSMACPPTATIDRGMTAGVWPTLPKSALHASLGPKVPKAMMRDEALEAAMVESFNAIGWDEQFFAAVIVSGEWAYRRQRGAITARSVQTYLASKRQNGTCMVQNFRVTQDRGESDWGTPKQSGVGSQIDIACPAGL